MLLTSWYVLFEPLVKRQLDMNYILTLLSNHCMDILCRCTVVLINCQLVFYLTFVIFLPALTLYIKYHPKMSFESNASKSVVLHKNTPLPTLSQPLMGWAELMIAHLFTKNTNVILKKDDSLQMQGWDTEWLIDSEAIQRQKYLS